MQIDQLSNTAERQFSQPQFMFEERRLSITDEKNQASVFNPDPDGPFFLSAILPCAPVSAAATLTLTAKPNSAGNYIALSWTNSDRSEPYSYMLFSKSTVESSFQSIPDKDHIKVLNIYPNNSGGKWPVTGTITFKSTLDGRSYTLPASASIKEWMEAANSDNANGYGKGLISVDAVSIPAFNSNPTGYLKNSDGSYKYDVVFYGCWDGNAGQDLTQAAENAVTTYTATGRGLLIGHDTACYVNPIFEELAPLVNMKASTGTPGDLGSTSVSIVKKGLLTNYPWVIGNVGTKLTIPLSHTTNQFAYGDVWLQYNPPFSTTFPGPQTTDSNGKETNNFYLTTWSNVAMIQTGHSEGQATPDEQKVLANCLFYLAQLTVNTSWNDHKGQDLAAPNTPSVTGVSLTSSQCTINYTSQDNAMGYQYYVEAIGQNDSQKYDSPIISTSIKSGLAGYSISVDNNPSGVPSSSITATASSYTFSRPAGAGFYIHVAAVDNAKNVSPVTTYHVQNIISVTHPVSVSYSINPNSNSSFAAPDIPITNDSEMPVSVTIEGLKSISGGSLTFTDVDPSSKNWSALGLADSKKYIALGATVKNSAGWNSGYNTGTYWGVNTSPMLVGILNPSATATLTLTANSGLAFDSACSAVHSLSFLFQLVQ